jgi:hypothetical protein
MQVLIGVNLMAAALKICANKAAASFTLPNTVLRIFIMLCVSMHVLRTSALQHWPHNLSHVEAITDQSVTLYILCCATATYIACYAQGCRVKMHHILYYFIQHDCATYTVTIAAIAHLVAQQHNEIVVAVAASSSSGKQQ